MSPCLRCDRAMRPKKAPPRPNTVAHQGRGLCHTCYQRLSGTGALDLYPRRFHSGPDLVTKWASAQRDGVPIDYFAARMGISTAAVHKAVARHEP